MRIPGRFIAIAAMAPLYGACTATAEPPAPPCTSNEPACLEQVAGMYLDALLTHDGSRLPLDPNVRRTENSLTNARGEHEVRESFVRTNMIERIRDARYYADVRTGDVIVFFRVDIDLKKEDGGEDGKTKAGDTEYRTSVSVPAGTYTVHEAERFKVVKGMITEIEIIAHVEKGKGGGSGWPEERADSVAKPDAE